MSQNKKCVGKSAILLALLAAALLSLLTGCAAKVSAPDVVQSQLDLLYHHTYTEESLALLDLTEEEAEALYAQQISTEVEAMCESYDLKPEECDAAIADELTALCQQIYAESCYTVGESTRTEEGYTVELTIAPMDLFTKIAQEDGEDFSQTWADRYTQGEFDEATQQEIETAWAQAIIDLVAARAEQIGYLDGETIQVSVVADEDGRWSISESDLANIDQLLS
jgi:hypothetical protein